MFRLTVQGTSLSLPTLSYREVVEACRQQNLPLDILEGCNQLFVNEFGEETLKVLLNGPELAALDAIGFSDLKGKVSLVNSTVSVFSAGGFNSYNTFRVRPLLSPIATTRVVGSIFVVELAGPWYWFDKCPAKNIYPPQSSSGIREPISGGVYNKTRHTSTDAGFWYYEDTTKTFSAPYTAKEIIEDLFSHATGVFNNTFPTLSGVTVVGNRLNHAISNFYVANKSVWQAIKEIVRLFRAGMFVNASGNLVITPYLTTDITLNGTGTLTSSLLVRELNYPNKVTVRYENREYQHFNFESDLIAGVSTSNYPLPYDDADTAVIGGGYPNQIITAPYIRKLPGQESVANAAITDIVQNLLDFYVSPAQIFTSVNDFPILYNRPLRVVLSVQKGYLEFDVRTQVNIEQYHKLPFHHYEKELIRELWAYKEDNGTASIYYPFNTSLLRKSGVTLETLSSSGTGGSYEEEEEEESEFKYCLQIGDRYYPIKTTADDPTEITVKGVQLCESPNAYYNETTDTITFGSGLLVSNVEEGHANVSLGVELTGQERVPGPCSCGNARFRWNRDTSEWDLIEACTGPDCTNPSPPAAPDLSACTNATYTWTVVGSETLWVLTANGCTGSGCSVPPPPTISGSSPGDVANIPCIVADALVPCVSTPPQQTSTNEFTGINFKGNLSLNQNQSDSCIWEVEGKTVFAVNGAEPTTEGACEANCGEAIFEWDAQSQIWTLLQPCTGDRCTTPDTPTDSPAENEIRRVPCIEAAEEIRNICVNAESLIFSEKFSVSQPTAGVAEIDIDLCRLFNDPAFKDFFCELVEECVDGLDPSGPDAEELCELLEECINEKIDDRLEELCSSTNVLVPIDEETAGTVDEENTRIEFECQTINFVTCPSKSEESTEECGPRYIEGTDCPEDEEAEPASEKITIEMLMQHISKLEQRITQLEAR